MNILKDLHSVLEIRGDTYSSYEVLGMIERAIDEIERLRAALRRIADHCVADALSASAIASRALQSDGP